ncbi:MAG: hypothetical protein AB1730_11355 [Myxococcota bacterium]
MKRVQTSASRFEAARAQVRRTGIHDGSARAARRELTKNLWALRSNLRQRNAPAAFEQAKSLATKLGVALSSTAKTAANVLTLIGKQLIRPEFSFKSMHDFPPIRAAAYARVLGGRINDPDPSGRIC